MSLLNWAFHILSGRLLSKDDWQHWIEATKFDDFTETVHPVQSD